MNHKDAQPLLALLAVDPGDLPAADWEALEAHVTNCEMCQADLEELSCTWSLLTSSMLKEPRDSLTPERKAQILQPGSHAESAAQEEDRVHTHFRISLRQWLQIAATVVLTGALIIMSQRSGKIAIQCLGGIDMGERTIPVVERGMPCETAAVSSSSADFYRFNDVDEDADIGTVTGQTMGGGSGPTNVLLEQEQVFMKNGKLADARERYEQALRKDPFDATAIRNLRHINEELLANAEERQRNSASERLAEVHWKWAGPVAPLKDMSDSDEEGGEKFGNIRFGDGHVKEKQEGERVDGDDLAKKTDFGGGMMGGMGAGGMDMEGVGGPVKETMPRKRERSRISFSESDGDSLPDFWEAVQLNSGDKGQHFAGTVGSTAIESKKAEGTKATDEKSQRYPDLKPKLSLGDDLAVVNAPQPSVAPIGKPQSEARAAGGNVEGAAEITDNFEVVDVSGVAVKKADAGKAITMAYGIPRAEPTVPAPKTTPKPPVTAEAFGMLGMTAPVPTPQKSAPPPTPSSGPAVEAEPAMIAGTSVSVAGYASEPLSREHARKKTELRRPKRREREHPAELRELEATGESRRRLSEKKMEETPQSTVTLNFAADIKDRLSSPGTVADADQKPSQRFFYDKAEALKETKIADGNAVFVDTDEDVVADAKLANITSYYRSVTPKHEATNVSQKLWGDSPPSTTEPLYFTSHIDKISKEQASRPPSGEPDIPLLGDIPLVGRLYSNSDTLQPADEKAKTQKALRPQNTPTRLYAAATNAMRQNDTTTAQATLNQLMVDYQGTPEAHQGLQLAREIRRKELRQGAPGDEAREALPPPPRTPPPPVNPFVMTEKDRLSTFSLEADTASYTMTRRYIRQGYLPPVGLVRMEEFINAFDYNYPRQSEKTFVVQAEGAPSPFGKGLTLLKIGVKGKVIGRDGRKSAHLVFVIDASGSMAREDRMPLVKYALSALLSQLKPSDRVTLVTYGTRNRLIREAVPASRRDDLLAAINAIECGTSTNIQGGVELGYQIAARHFQPGAINRVILCSDGVANVGAAEAETVLKRIDRYRKQNITLTCVGVGAGSYDDRLLEQLANKGDGNYVFIDSREEVKRVFVEEFSGTLQTIAKDVKIQVEFNPNRVRRYRLIGYENRAIADKDFRNDAVDAGEIGSGQSATALYELELITPKDEKPEDIGTVYVRYRDIDTLEIEEIESRLRNDTVRPRDSATSPRFFLAACAAEFAEVLRNSEYAQGSQFQNIATTLLPAADTLPLDERVQELLVLLEQAEGLPRAQ